MCKCFVLDKEHNVIVKSTNSYDTLYKACGYRKNINFEFIISWEDITLNGIVFSVQMWAKTAGKTNTLNDISNICTLDHPVYGPCCFIFLKKNEIFNEIELHHWYSFLEYINETVEKSKPDKAEITTADDIDSESECEIEETDHESLSSGENVVEKKTNELDYEEYYFSSDDEQ